MSMPVVDVDIPFPESSYAKSSQDSDYLQSITCFITISNILTIRSVFEFRILVLLANKVGKQTFDLHSRTQKTDL